MQRRRSHIMFPATLLLFALPLIYSSLTKQPRPPSATTVDHFFTLS